MRFLRAAAVLAIGLAAGSAHADFLNLTFSSNGVVLAATNPKGTQILAWNVADGARRILFKPKGGDVVGLRFSPKSANSIAALVHTSTSVEDTDTLISLNSVTRRTTGSVELTRPYFSSRIDYLPNGSRAGVLFPEKTRDTFITSVAPKFAKLSKPTLLPSASQSVSDIAYIGPTELVIMRQGHADAIHVVNPKTGRLTRVIDLGCTATAVAVSKAARKAVASCYDSDTSKVFDLATGALVTQSTSSTYLVGVDALAFNADGSKVIAAGFGGGYAFDAVTGVELLQFKQPGYLGWVSGVTVSPLGVAAVSTSYGADGFEPAPGILLFDIATGNLLRILR